MALFGKRGPRPDPSRGPTRLHIGCGQQAIAGWINIDNQGLPGVDQVLDVRQRAPVRRRRRDLRRALSRAPLARRRAGVSGGVPARAVGRRRPEALHAEPRLGPDDPLPLGRRLGRGPARRLHPRQPRVPRLGPPVPLQPAHAGRDAPRGRLRARRLPRLRRERTARAAGARTARDLERHARASPRHRRGGLGRARARSAFRPIC